MQPSLRSDSLSTRSEAGVRNLERQVANVCRKVAKEIIRANEISKHQLSEKTTKKKTAKRTKVKSQTRKKSFPINSKKVVELLGPHKYKHGKIETDNEIGMTNGMAYTEVGGDLLAVEATVIPGRGKFTITGQLGDVMKESCTAALSYVRSRGPLVWSR
jgi:ATP-dependent Lon protease